MFLLAGACGPAQLQLPNGVTCSKTYAPGSGATELSDALSRAASGDCVVAPTGSTRQALTVPAGVHLTSQMGAAVELQSSGTDPVVRLSGGASLSGVTISSAAGVAVRIDGHATLANVKIDRAAGVGIVAWCEEDCHTDPTSTLTDVEVTGSKVGLWARGTNVTVKQGRFAESDSQSLGGGYGVVASHGAALSMEGTLIDSNHELGLLVDGASGTSTALTQVTVKDNLGRGIWAQGLVGTAATPKLTLDGCTLQHNAIAALGARASTGIRVQGGRIADTQLAPALTATPGVTAMVGDGVGVFEGTGELSMRSVTVESNARAQLLVDTGAAGVSFQLGTITQGSGAAGVVVQRTTATVDAPNITTPAAGNELPVSSLNIAVPTGP
ncbi:MAG: right-handed parallel beta-helix repeat-containing protein [Archangiaceae bacterium]|nr:right-handed parallel beta-helix repeat-containing protein [Archangiaceae bacterium]